MTIEKFLLGMLSLGYPLDVSLVGVFDESGRGSRRDIELPLHKDGVYSESLAKIQGGEYVEQKNIDFVGMYCIVEEENCITLLENQEVILKKGQALIFDNNRILHGRQGLVGKRLLLRMWVKRK